MEWLQIKIPTERLTRDKWEKTRWRREIDWSLGSYIGCCVERFGIPKTHRPCYQCIRLIEWRNLFYEFHTEQEEVAYIRSKKRVITKK
jgi:hypothetical protein